MLYELQGCVWMQFNTQSLSRLNPLDPEPGWLYTVKELHSQRAPGMTCLSALRNARAFVALLVHTN